MKSFESRLTIFLSYSFIQRARAGALVRHSVSTMFQFFFFPLPPNHPPPSTDPNAANWEREREREEERDTLFTKVRYFPRARLLPVLSLDPLPATIQNVCGSLTFFLNVRCKSSKI